MRLISGSRRESHNSFTNSSTDTFSSFKFQSNLSLMTNFSFISMSNCKANKIFCGLLTLITHSIWIWKLNWRNKYNARSILKRSKCMNKSQKSWWIVIYLYWHEFPFFWKTCYSDFRFFIAFYINNAALDFFELRLKAF